MRELADSAGILSGSLYHHFDSKASIGDQILSDFINAILADYRAAVASAGDPRAAIEQIVRSTSGTLARHRAAVGMLQSDWSYFSTQPRFGYLPAALKEIEGIWVTQLELGRRAGIFRQDLDPKLTYRLLRDVLWIPAQWGRTSGYSTAQVADGLLRILFDGIAASPAVTLSQASVWFWAAHREGIMGRLEGKVALITGAARGMGKSHVRHFVSEGARVVFGDVLDDKGAAVAGETGRRLLPVRPP